MKRLLGLVAIVALVASVVVATPQKVSAGEYGLWIHEDINYHGDTLWLNYPSTGYGGWPDLRNVTGNIIGFCENNYQTISWNDCISSIGAFMPTYRCLRFYQAPNYSGAYYTWTTKGTATQPSVPFLNADTWGAGWNDSISSIRWGHNAQNQYGAWQCYW